MLIAVVIRSCRGLSALLGGRLGSRFARRLVVWLVLLVVTTPLLLAGGYGYWYYHRPLPAPLQRPLFRGIAYTREVRPGPHPLVTHIVTVDLTAPGIHFLVTPGDPSAEHPLRARTTSGFLEEFHAQVAINGSFFTPWHANGPWDYYPHIGDPVTVHGLAISADQRYAAAKPGCNTLFIGADNRAAIGTDFVRAMNAISGREVIVTGGRPADDFGTATDAYEPHPRTAVALDATGTYLLLVVVDGRQPNYSEGVTLAELARIIVAHRGATALNLDGGGSSTLVVQGPDGRPRVVNSPIHGRHPPGRERPVANHLGVFANPE